MKSPTLSQPRPSWLHRLIQDATGAPTKDLARIENIMRDEIFHSTLDWQTREQLANTARQAVARLAEDRELYDLEHACRMAMLHKMRVESTLREHNTSANRAPVVAAETNYQSARANLLVRLDETKPN